MSVKRLSITNMKSRGSQFPTNMKGRGSQFPTNMKGRGSQFPTNMRIPVRVKEKGTERGAFAYRSAEEILQVSGAGTIRAMESAA